MNWAANWWKVLSVILLAYVFSAGFLIPLRPGISNVQPNRTVAGTTLTIDVEGYNSHFASARTSMQAWLKLSPEHAWAARTLRIHSETAMTCVFDVPPFLPEADSIQIATLVLSNHIDGYSYLPSAVFIKQSNIDMRQGRRAWGMATMNVEQGDIGIRFPYRNILLESIRNTFFHTSLWFAMIALLIASLWYSIRYLRSPNPVDDMRVAAFVTVGILFGLLGTATGSIWARFTWGAFWTSDVKLNMTAVSLLIYLAYWVLRATIEDADKRARVTAAYNIFAFCALIPLIFVVPRMTDSLHPGSGGNPAFGSEDMDNTLRMVFYPAIIGLILLGLWMTQIYVRIQRLKLRFWMGDDAGIKKAN